MYIESACGGRAQYTFQLAGDQRKVFIRTVRVAGAMVNKCAVIINLETH